MIGPRTHARACRYTPAPSPSPRAALRRARARGPPAVIGRTVSSTSFRKAPSAAACRLFCPCPAVFSCYQIPPVHINEFPPSGGFQPSTTSHEPAGDNPPQKSTGKRGIGRMSLTRAPPAGSSPYHAPSARPVPQGKVPPGEIFKKRPRGSREQATTRFSRRDALQKDMERTDGTNHANGTQRRACQIRVMSVLRG